MHDSLNAAVMIPATSCLMTLFVNLATHASINNNKAALDGTGIND